MLTALNLPTAPQGPGTGLGTAGQSSCLPQGHPDPTLS